MAISPYFQNQINLVDPTKVLTFVVDETYNEFAWSYNGLECRGGCDLACEYAASELLEAMGFRFYTPEDWGIVRPATIATGLSAGGPTNEYFMPTNACFLVYGHSWAQSLAASRNILNGRQAIWEVLNSLDKVPWPAGHRWGAMIDHNGNRDWFQENPTAMIGGAPTDTANAAGLHFDLRGIWGTELYDELVTLCAAYLLTSGFNEWNRTHFDPSDGDSNPSDYVFPFTQDVAQACRAGTPIVHNYPAMPGNPEAQLGIYAYANHRLPPTESVAPEVYTQVALAFNDTALTFVELVQQHGAKSAGVLLREYWDTETWSMSKPFIQGITKNAGGTEFAQYAIHRASGAVGVNAEFTANWLVNLVGTRRVIRYLKTGSYTYDQALDDVMTDLFDDDPAVRALYELWSAPTESYNAFNLRRSLEHIDDMLPSWYKTLFQYYAVILAEFEYLPGQTPLALQDETDPFPAAFSSMMTHVAAVRELGIMHSYAFMRQQANSRVATNYYYLKWGATPEPTWHANPVLPTEAEFDSWLAILQADTVREEILDTDNLVVVRGVYPADTTQRTRTAHGDRSSVRFIFMGPGSISINRAGITTVTEYGEGMHRFNAGHNITVWNSGGTLFFDSFPQIRKDPTTGTGTGNWYMYVHQTIAGAVDLAADSRWRFYDETGQFNLVPVGNVAYIPPVDLGPGIVTIDNINTRGTLWNGNVNRYISPMRDAVLTTAELVAQEWPETTPKLIVRRSAA